MSTVKKGRYYEVNAQKKDGDFSDTIKVVGRVMSSVAYEIDNSYGQWRSYKATPGKSDALIVKKVSDGTTYCIPENGPEFIETVGQTVKLSINLDLGEYSEFEVAEKGFDRIKEDIIAALNEADIRVLGATFNSSDPEEESEGLTDETQLASETPSADVTEPSDAVNENEDIKQDKSAFLTALCAVTGLLPFQLKMSGDNWITPDNRILSVSKSSRVPAGFTLWGSSNGFHVFKEDEDLDEE